MKDDTSTAAASKRLEIRLPASLRAMLNAAAKACSLSLSAYVRDRLTHAAQQDLQQAKGNGDFVSARHFDVKDVARWVGMSADGQ